MDSYVSVIIGIIFLNILKMREPNWRQRKNDNIKSTLKSIFFLIKTFKKFMLIKISFFDYR